MPHSLKRAKRSARYLALRAFAALVSLLPVRIASGLGAAFGHLAYFCAPKERRKALDSLTRAFPQLTSREHRLLARATFAHLGRCAFELVCLEQIDARVEAWVEWPAEDRAVLDAALARGKGVVFVSGHVGHWELLARRIALAGYPAQTIAKETTDPRTTAWVERLRSSSRLKSIWRGQPGAAKHMLRALRQGEILGMVIDQDTDVQSVFVPFFGALAKTPRAAADLALRTQAAVVMGFCQRQPSGRYRLFMEELPLPAPAPSEPAALALTATMTARIEAAIRRAPEQWVWLHRRWKSRP